MIDVHCHLIDDGYKGIETQELIDEARNAGVEMIVNGTGLYESKKSLELAEKNDGVWVCVGLAYESRSTNYSNLYFELEKMAKSRKVVGVGEAGLNYYEGMSDDLLSHQKKLFEMHLRLATELDLPIEIHNRNADLDIYNFVEKYRPKAILHSFNGDEDFMNKMVDLGCYFSIGGMVTYKKNVSLRNLIPKIPINKILVETDSPYLPPEPLRGTINTPKNVKISGNKIAELLGKSIEQIEELTTNNTRNIFTKLI